MKAGPEATGHRMLSLQRTIGNRAVTHMLGAQRPSVSDAAAETPGAEAAEPEAGDLGADSALSVHEGGYGVLMRDLLPIKDWKTRSATDDAGKKQIVRSSALKSVDKALKKYNQQNGFPQHDFGFAAINALINAIANYLASRATKGSRITQVTWLQGEATRELGEVNEMRGIRDRLRDNMGIALDNPAGIDAITRLYMSFGGKRKTFKKLKEMPWKLSQLRHVEAALTPYAPLLGTARPNALGAQSISSFSRLRAGASVDDDDKVYVEGENGTDMTTFGETFTQNIGGVQLGNISMFNAADEVTDFAQNKNNPTPEELAKGYQGTMVHELSHALIESLPPPAAGETFPDGSPVDNMIRYFARHTAFWTDVFTKSGTVGSEDPITGYGKKNAKEDLAEAMMFFVIDPATLQRKCPQRWAFITTHLTAYLNPVTMAASKQAAKDANPDLNAPPLPPAPMGGAPVVAPPTGGVTPQSLQSGKDNLKAVIPNPPPLPNMPLNNAPVNNGGITPESLQSGKDNLKAVIPNPPPLPNMPVGDAPVNTGGITPEALQEGKDNLKPPPPTELEQVLTEVEANQPVALDDGDFDDSGYEADVDMELDDSIYDSDSESESEESGYDGDVDMDLVGEDEEEELIDTNTIESTPTRNRSYTV
jgi:hypothetical protein